MISKNFVIFTFLCIILMMPAIYAENITFDVYPSDEELYEAYLRGDIDYQTYLNLSEIFEDGIDSTELYLLEEIPNISFFLKSNLTDYSELEKEQTETYITKDKEKIGWLKARTYQKLEEDGDFKNHYLINSRLGSEWSCRGEFKQNYEGTKRWTRRSLSYQTNRGDIKKIIIGNYNTRFGLGLTVGYHGKLLEKSDATVGQTVAFPDYGGFNGIYIEGGRRRDSLKLLMHYDRDNETELLLGALGNKRRYKNFTWEGIVLGATVKNRLINKRYTHYQLGTFLEYSKYSYTAGAEMALARGKDKMVPAAILETTYRQEDVSLKFSVWHYGRGFINLAGGGRAGSIYQTVAIDTIDYEFRDKRTDQSGVLLKSRVDFDNDIELNFSFTAYGKDKFDKAAAILTGFIYPLNDKSSVGIDYDYSRRDRPGEVLTSNEIRAVYRLRKKALSLRSYLGYNIDKAYKKYVSGFTRLRSEIKRLGILELWFNMDKIDYKIGRIDYFYGYIKETFYLMGALELAAKYSYRFNRFYTNPELSIFLLEMKLIW